MFTVTKHDRSDPAVVFTFCPAAGWSSVCIVKMIWNFPDISHSFILMYLLFFSVEGRSVITVMFQLFFCCCYMDWFYNWNPFTEPIFFIGNLIASAFLCSMVCHCMYAISVPRCVHVKMSDQSLWVLWLFYVPIFMATSRACHMIFHSHNGAALMHQFYLICFFFFQI